MATAFPPHSVFAELSAHTLSLAVLSGRKVTALRTFSLDAKPDITAFTAEHRLAGITRVAFLGAKNFIHPSGDQETATLRQPAALLSHVAGLPHGFDGTPVSVVVDAATGLPPDLVQAFPWIAAAVPSSQVAAAKEKLAALGLAPAAFTLAAPVQFGVIAASLAEGETALVVLPGEDESHLAWINSAGLEAVAVLPCGFGQIFEAVQNSLGLKFKSAAVKLFYNENYDFGETAPKIAAALAPALQPFLADTPATHLHIVALTPSQAWLTHRLGAALQLTPWAPDPAAFTANLSLDTGAVTVAPTHAGVLQLASSGTADAAWVLAPLAAQAAKPLPPKPAPAAAAKSTAPATPAPAPAAKSKAPPGPQPATPPPPAARPAAKTPAPPPAAAKGKLRPLLIGSAAVALAALVAIGVFFTRSGDQPPAKPATVAPSSPTPPHPPAPEPSPLPTILSDDQFTADLRKYGNNRYRFEVTDKGFIQAISIAGNKVLVESAAGISLQGSYVGSDGRRKWFNVGGVDDLAYVATVAKSVKDGLPVFEVRVTHPRFDLAQTFTCLPGSIQVTARFNPINLRDPRGVIVAAHSVRLSPVALDPTQRMKTAEGSLTYTTKAGPLVLTFDHGFWSRDGLDGRQTVIAGENGAAFHFTDSTDPARNVLHYEIRLP